MDGQSKEISWNKNEDEDVYRASTCIQSPPQSQHLSFGAQSFPAKTEILRPFEAPSDGNALDIYGGHHSVFPMKPLGMNPKQRPVVEVIESVEADADPSELKGDDDAAPIYDGFQSLYGHRSSTKSPTEMARSVGSTLQRLCASGSIDYHQLTPFAFAGRAFGKYQDCEFKLSIFSDESSESVLEMRKTAGESFQYQSIECRILSNLVEAGALPSNTDSGHDDSDDERSMGPFNVNSIGFGLPAFPSLDSMEVDSNFSASDVDELKAMTSPMSTERATQLLQDAVDLNAMRDELRTDIATLNDEMTKEEVMFAAIPNALSKIVEAMTSDRLFDCWAIKSYLEMTSKLISHQTASKPPSLAMSVEKLKDKWSRKVINEVAPGVSFEFYPSQQIVSLCNVILDALK